MFSEESCGTENWSYDAENSGLPSQELIITVCVCVCYVFLHVHCILSVEYFMF